jgi:glycosyltransferase involved in cell wall biosynthesis
VCNSACSVCISPDNSIYINYFKFELCVDRVALSPVRFGGGLKIKVFEALSFGKPVLATQHSIDGFPKNI